MPIVDLEIIGKDELPALKSGICIVGSGPAGCTVERECAELGLQVTMLESGGFERGREADALNEIDNVGRPRVLDQWAVRNRIVGGSSHVWGGRCAPFDSIDFEAEAWVPDSGWPFEIEALDPYLDRTAPYLGLAVGRGFSDERFWTFARRSPPPAGPDPEWLLPFFWQFSRPSSCAPGASRTPAFSSRPMTRRPTVRMAELVSKQFDRMVLPRLGLADWVRDGADLPSTFVDVAHPTGTTRMCDDLRRGVVDRDCRDHGVDGLYVSGSSVFPTSGHCNPTQMIVALALRLADHLKSRLKTVEQVSIRTVAAPKPKTQRILVTGATGRIGHVVVADLIERGYLVPATTSKEPPGPELHGAAVEWRRFDFHQATDYDDLLAGCDAVLHIAAELGDKDRMWRTNVEATRLLAAASERADTKAFCYTSSVAVYGSGRQRIMTEDAPVLTADRDIRSEYWSLEYVRAYGRTKLGGELALRQQAKSVRYSILRPTVVVDVAGIIAIRDWPRVKRTLAAHRHALMSMFEMCRLPSSGRWNALSPDQGRWAASRRTMSRRTSSRTAPMPASCEKHMR